MPGLTFRDPQAEMRPRGYSMERPRFEYTGKEWDAYFTKRPATEMFIDVFVMASTLLSIALQLTGMLVPGWWILPSDKTNTNTNTSTTTYGLWTTVVCVGDVCTETETDTSGSNAFLQVTQVFESGAVAFSLLGVLCYLMTSVKHDLEFYLLLRRLTVFLLAASATSVLIGMAVFLKKSAGLTRYPQRTTAGGHLDWPIAFSLAACVTSVLVAVVVGVRLHRERVE